MKYATISYCFFNHCRSPHGECGLKSQSRVEQYVYIGRSPHGECGLKFRRELKTKAVAASLPAWGVWIEISKYDLYFSEHDVAPRMGSVD